MTNYIRVMHPGEAEVIRNTGTIPPNRDPWGDHAAGTVVFLFESDRVSWAYVRARVEDIVEDCGSAVILTFDGRLPCGTDRSGWDQGGAIVHQGPIALENVVNPQWRLYTRLTGQAACNTQAAPAGNP